MFGSILAIFWILVSVIGFPLALITEYLTGLPQLLQHMYAYGKLLKVHDKKAAPAIQLLQVPKSWYLHFYLTGVVVNGYALITLTRFYVYHVPLPSWIQTAVVYLDIDQQISTDSLSVLLLVCLMLVQNARRLYECVYVSVYSKGSMHVLHYSLGMILYTTYFLALLVEAPHDREFINSKEKVLSNLSWRHVAGVVLFIWSSIQHHKIHKQLGAFRRNDKGHVVSMQHVMPHGGWFELVSTPHFFMELLIYVSFLLIAGYRHVTLLSIFLFVITNQIITSLLTHGWYKKEFKDYPSGRKAIFPYLL